MREGGDDHRGAQADSPGLAGDGGGQHAQRWTDAVGGEVMLGEPDRVEAHLVGQPALLQRIVVDLGVSLPVAEGEQVLDGELHGRENIIRGLVYKGRQGGTPTQGENDMAQLKIPLDAQRFAKGLTWKDYTAQMGETQARTEENYRKSGLTDEERKFFNGISQVRSALMLAENWCGDVHRN